jgi:hypothetical protein
MTLRRLSAIAILAVGAVHLKEYLGDGYQSIPTIGPLFLRNGGIAGAGGRRQRQAGGIGCQRSAPAESPQRAVAIGPDA